MMPSVLSRSDDVRLAPCSFVSIAVVSAAGLAWANRAPPVAAQASCDLPTRLHAAAGWGEPALDATTVYVLSRHHELFAVDRGSGAVQWRQPLADGPAATQGVNVLTAGRLVVAGDGGVFAFTGRTGTPVWRIGADGNAGRTPGRFIGSAVTDTIWLGSASGVVSAVDVSSGELRWRTQVAQAQVTVFAPVVDGDLLVAAFTDFAASPREGGLVAMDAGTGAIRWLSRFVSRAPPLPASAGGPPLIAGDLVVAASSDGAIHVVRRVNGEERWTLPAVAGGDLLPAHEDFRALAVVRPHLIATSLSGVLVAYGLDAPVERWRFVSPPDGSIAFALTVADARVYVPFASGRLLVVSAADGRLIRVIGGGSRRFEWPAVIGGGELYLVAEDGLYGCDVASP
jgi:outer membrane protein assembly factor BamB